MLSAHPESQVQARLPLSHHTRSPQVSTNHFFPGSKSTKTGLGARLGSQATLCSREPHGLVHTSHKQRGHG